MSSRVDRFDGPSYLKLTHDMVEHVEWHGPDGQKLRAPLNGAVVGNGIVTLEAPGGHQYRMRLESPKEGASG